MTPPGGFEERPDLEVRSLSVPPAPLRDPGGGRRSAGIAFTVVALVVGAAIAIPLIIAGPPGSTAPSMPSVVAARPSRAAIAPSDLPGTMPAPSPSTGPSLPLPASAYNAHELGQMVQSGELDGRLVLVRGNLESIDLGCDREPDALHTCVMLAIEGVDAPVNAAWTTLPWHDEPVAGDYLVVVPGGGSLWYIGHLAPTLDMPTTIDGLTRALLREDGARGAPSRLFLVDGWLIPRPPVGCPSPREPAATPCFTPGPFLADEQPADGGVARSARGSSVVLGNAIGVPADRAVIEGPFLVAMLSAEQCATAQLGPLCAGSGARWLLEARYDIATDRFAHVP